MATFEQVHHDNADRLKRYIAIGRKRSVRLDRATMTEFDPDRTIELFANNPDARIRFAEIFTTNLRRFIGAAPPDTEYFWITIAPRKFARTIADAHRFDSRAINGWTHQMLRGWNYVGMVEASLYGNVAVKLDTRTVSWHVHLIAWGVTARDVRARMRSINRGTRRSLVEGIPAAYAVPVRSHEVLGKALYMSKSPRSETRAYPRKTTNIDRSTGEIMTCATGRFVQVKRDLRSGDLARMAQVMAGRRLDHLSIAGGAGKPIMQAVRAAALQPMRAAEAEQKRMREAKTRATARSPQVHQHRKVQRV